MIKEIDKGAQSSQGENEKRQLDQAMEQLYRIIQKPEDENTDDVSPSNGSNPTGSEKCKPEKTAIETRIDQPESKIDKLLFRQPPEPRKHTTYTSVVQNGNPVLRASHEPPRQLDRH